MKWIKVGNMLPEHNQIVIAWIQLSANIWAAREVIFNGKHKTFWFAENRPNPNCTHWQPLPEPPTEEE